MLKKTNIFRMEFSNFMKTNEFMTVLLVLEKKSVKWYTYIKVPMQTFTLIYHSGKIAK